MNRTDVCPADIAEIADFVNRAARKMLFQELKKRTANMSTYQIRINVSGAEFVPACAPAESGKSNGASNIFPLPTGEG